MNPAKAGGFTITQERIGSIDAGNMPDDEGWIMLHLNLAKKNIEFVGGQAQVAVRFESFGMVGN